jgi:hypothetical protein
VIPAGVRVHITHLRRPGRPIPGRGGYVTKRELRAANVSPAPRGGCTYAELYDADDRLLAAATAVCSDQDQFNRRIGRDIALGRALKNLNEQ